MGFLNKLWSGLDFWDKKENQGQRQSFAQQDEEERRRRQQQQAAASVQRPSTQPNTPGITQVNTTPKPITAGSQSDFTQPQKPATTFDFTKPLQKDNPTSLNSVLTKPAIPQAPTPTTQPQAPATPKPQVPQAPKPTPNPVDLRSRAATYQNPNVQDVNNYYGSDLKVLNEELAKGDNADMHRVEGLMRSLDNRKKELQDFHTERGNNQSFKSARELEQHIKETRGDWSKQNQALKDFWDGVRKNETGDFEQYLAEKTGQTEPGNIYGMQLQGTWKNGTGMNNVRDFQDDVNTVAEVKARQQIADTMNSDKFRDVPLDQIDGNKTTAMHLRDFKEMSPEEQQAFMANLGKIIEDNQNNTSGNKDLSRKAQQAFMLQQTLLDSGLQRDNFRTRWNKFTSGAGKVGDAIMESPQRLMQSEDVLIRQALGVDQKPDMLTKQHDAGQISDEEYNREMNKYTRDTAWAGDGSQGRGHDLLVAAGTSADIVSTFLPVLSAAKGATGAYTAEKLAAQIAAEQGISRSAARVAAKETLQAFAEEGAKDTLKQTMAKEALANGIFSGVGSLRDGTFDPEKTLKETVTGAAIGGGAPVVGDLLGKGTAKVLSKFRGGDLTTELPQSLEDMGRVSSRLEGDVASEGADQFSRASYMKPEQQSRIAELEQIVDDPNMPSYQKLAAKEELQTLESTVDDQMAKALGGADTPIDTTPAYEHRNQIAQILDDHNLMLMDYLNTLPNPTPQDIEIATQAAKSAALDEINKLKVNRYGASFDATPNANIPDPATDRIALAKADINSANDTILPDSFAPPEKVTPAAQLEKASAATDNMGNAALRTDAERAAEMTDNGMTPAVGASQVAQNENRMAAAAERTAGDQVSLTNPTTGATATNQTAERILADPRVPADTKAAINNLTHEVHNDKIMIESAQNLVKQDLNSARQLFDDGALITSANLDGHIHLGNALNEEYNRIGNMVEAGKVYDGLIAASTRYGQGMRALQAISKISPQGIVEYARNIASKAGKHLSPELENELVDTARSVAQMAPGEEKAAAIREMINLARQPSAWDTAGEFFKGVLSAPRGLMATGDLSFAIRQGGVLGSRYPKEWAQALKNSAEYAVSEEKFQQGMTRLANLTDENGENLLPVFQKMELSLPAVTGQAEEVFGNTSVLESKALKKVGVGHVVAGSDRAFSGAAAELRANVAKKIIDGYGGVAAMANWTEKDFKDLGRVLNTATGRGMGGSGMVGRAFEKAAPFLSDTLFSARLWKSRLDLLNPIYYARLAPAARKVALQSSSSFAAVVSATLAAAAAAGAAVEMDPRSSDFGKIKIGNTRYDIMGGLQQNIVLAARELTGEKKTGDGSIVDLTEGGYGQPNRFTTLSDFVTNKETPVLATATRLLKGKDIGGNDVNPWTEVAKLFIPLGLQDVNALVQDRAGNGDATQTPGEAAKNWLNPADTAKSVGQATPGFFGVGVQTYGSSTKNVAADSGTDPTTLDPKQLKKYEDNVNKSFVKSLSKDEQRVYNLTKDEKLQKLALDKGSVTQDQLDKVLAKENAALEKAGLPTNEPKLPTKEEIQARVEEGNYGAAIKGYERQIKAAEKDKNMPKSKKDELVVEKKRLEVTDAGGFTPDIIKLYHDTSNAEWRKMTDPDSEDYDPETAGKLQLYDEQLTRAKVSGGKKLDETKFYAKGARGKEGSGGGRGGSKMSTDIATNKQSFDNFTPIKPQKATAAAPESAIPTLEKVPNYSRQLKKISVSK